MKNDVVELTACKPSTSPRLEAVIAGSNRAPLRARKNKCALCG